MAAASIGAGEAVLAVRAGAWGVSFGRFPYVSLSMLYREELASQASAIGLIVRRFPRKSDQIAAASKALGCSASEVATILSNHGFLSLSSIGGGWVGAASLIRLLSAVAQSEAVRPPEPGSP